MVEAPATFAAETGFTGERAVDTWRKRMKTLRDLEFIRTKRGPSGEFHFILLLNPNIAVERMREKKMVQDGLYGRFRDRVAEIRAAGDWPAHQGAMQDSAAKAAEVSAKAKPTKAPAHTTPAKKGSATLSSADATPRSASRATASASTP